MRTSSPRWPLLLCVVAAVTWVACSDGDDGAAPPPETGCDPAQAAASGGDDASCEPTDVDDLDGGVLYAQSCASCHQADGSGIDGVFPALAGNTFVTTADPTGAIATVLNGRAGMPRWGGELTDAQIAAILSYVRSSLGDNDAREVTADEVAEVREEQGTHPADH